MDDGENRWYSDLYTDKHLDFGTLACADGKVKTLRLRDVPNKIIHAARFEWHIPAATRGPIVECFASSEQQQRGGWASAKINLNSLAALCGTLDA